jgi:hypothetical protein
MKRREARMIFLLVLVLRVAVAAQFRGNFDSGSYLIVADAVLSGQNVYAVTDRYNYSPLWSYVVAALWSVSAPNIGLFVLLAGLFQVGVDVVTAWLLLRLARDRLGRTPEEARRVALIFFANPVSVLISCAHGQFDGLSILFLVAALSAAMGPERPLRRAGVVGFLSLSLLVKHITAFHPPLFWRGWRRRGLPLPLLAVPYAVFALSFVPFLSSSRTIAGNVLLYATWLAGPKLQRPGGTQVMLRFARSPALAYFLVCLAVVAAAIWIARRLELPRACLLVSLALLVSLPGHANQYFVWPMALGSLYASPGYALCAGAAALLLSGESLDLAWPVTVTIPGAWLAALLWFLAELRQAALAPPLPESSGAAPLRAEATAPAPSPDASGSPSAQA